MIRFLARFFVPLWWDDQGARAEAVTAAVSSVVVDIKKCSDFHKPLHSPTTLFNFNK